MGAVPRGDPPRGRRAAVTDAAPARAIGGDTPADAATAAAATTTATTTTAATFKVGCTLVAPVQCSASAEARSRLGALPAPRWGGRSRAARTDARAGRRLAGWCCQRGRGTTRCARHVNPPPRVACPLTHSPASPHGRPAPPPFAAKSAPFWVGWGPLSAAFWGFVVAWGGEARSRARPSPVARRIQKKIA
eukprot:scaffold1165_cov323-Prasinococcus_capsulatus_cf.AAC.6